jgi:FkbM family methyltransferase
MGRDRRVTLRPGWTLTCHRGAYRTAYAAQVDDPVQRAELDAFLATATEGMVLFDAGAHFGIFSLAAAHYGGPAARAIAVDPSPTAIRMVGLHARLNGFGDRIVPVCAAVSESAGSLELVDAGVIAAGYFVPPEPDHGSAERTEVPTVTLDGLAERFGRPTHVKIDVEGFELAALRGARGVLAAPHAPLIFLELHCEMIRAHGGEPGDVLTLLQEANYRTFDDSGAPLSREAALASPLVRLVARRGDTADATGRDLVRTVEVT